MYSAKFITTPTTPSPSMSSLAFFAVQECIQMVKSANSFQGGKKIICMWSFAPTALIKDCTLLLSMCITVNLRAPSFSPLSQTGVLFTAQIRFVKVRLYEYADGSPCINKAIVLEAGAFRFMLWMHGRVSGMCLLKYTLRSSLYALKCKFLSFFQARDDD